jgi:hypothetical protein
MNVIPPLIAAVERSIQQATEAVGPLACAVAAAVVLFGAVRCQAVCDRKVLSFDPVE